MSTPPPVFPSLPTETSISNEESRKPILRRSSLDLKFDVLRAVRDGPNGKQIPTRVMARANLSWNVCVGILKQLEEAGLIQTQLKRMNEKHAKRWQLDGPELHYDKKKGQKIISLTGKGIEVIAAYEKILDDVHAEERFRKVPLMRRTKKARGFLASFWDGSSKIVGRGLVAD